MIPYTIECIIQKAGAEDGIKDGIKDGTKDGVEKSAGGDAGDDARVVLDPGARCGLPSIYFTYSLYNF